VSQWGVGCWGRGWSIGFGWSGEYLLVIWALRSFVRVRVVRRFVSSVGVMVVGALVVQCLVVRLHRSPSLLMLKPLGSRGSCDEVGVGSGGVTSPSAFTAGTGTF
jgi:hypothetical protein